MPELAAHGRGLQLAYGPVVAVGESDFDIPRRALTAIIGPNGSGKSTLLNAIAGLLPPAAGALEVLGGDPADVRNQIAYAVQAAKVNEAMPVTVKETVAMGRYARVGVFGLFRNRDRRAVARAMERVDVARLAGAQLSELSGGQRQRVFVAQVLVQEADLLLLDEPLTGLDLVARELLLGALRDEIEAGRTVVLTTHDLSEASAADHVVLMSGKVHTQGRPAEVLDPDRLSDAYGIGIVHLEDGSIVLDDPHHRARPHVHFERGGPVPD